MIVLCTILTTIHPHNRLNCCGIVPSPQVHNVQDLEHVMTLGSNNRSVGATLMNVDSSRSHSIFSIELEMMEKTGGSEGGNLRAGKLNLVDLAGSERQSKTGSTGKWYCSTVT